MLLQEAAENHIDLPKDEPAIIKLLLQYLYTSEYSPQYTLMPDDVETERFVCFPRLYQRTWPHTCAPGCTAQLCEHHHCSVHCISDCSDMNCVIEYPPRKDPPNMRWILDGGSEQLLTHSKMYTIGDKYDVPGLKELAKGKFQSVCVRFSESEDFVVAAEHAFSTTMDDDEGLRKIVRDILMARKGMLVRPNVKAFLMKEPELMYEILIKATQ
jgi:hypothetical protein